MNTTVNGPEPELLPSRVEHDVHEQRGHGRQRVRVQAGHAEHVAGTRQGVNDGTGHLKSKQTAQFTNRKHKQGAAVMLVRSPGVWKVNRDSIKLHFFVFWGVFFWCLPSFGFTKPLVTPRLWAATASPLTTRSKVNSDDSVCMTMGKSRSRTWGNHKKTKECVRDTSCNPAAINYIDFHFWLASSTLLLELCFQWVRWEKREVGGKQDLLWEYFLSLFLQNYLAAT